MVDSQPGKVIAFNPSITLQSFAASTRDRLLFDENQLVLAKVQQPRPVFASAINRSNTGALTVFANYKNISGEFAYIDRSFQALSTTGVPTLPVHQISIGYDQQIPTNKVKFWSVGFVNTALLTVEFSFDNVTYFTVGTVNWVQAFDDTIQINPNDNPPTGEFTYTGTFASGTVTARYWRIRSDAAQTVTAFASGTVTVASTAQFPSFSTSVVLYNSSGVFKGTGSYTAKTGTTLTGYTGTTPAITDTIVNIANPFGDLVTEVEILQVTIPVLERWNSDGVKVVTNEFEGDNYYDAYYDKNEDVFYAIQFNQELSGFVPPTMNDDFNETAYGDFFNPTKWIEDATNLYFLHNTSSGTLDMRSSGGSGQLTTNYGVDGDFTADIELVAALQLGSKGYFALEAKDYTSGNEYMLSAIKGPYTPGVDTSGSFISAAIEYTSTVGSSAILQNFRVRASGFDFGFAGGVVQYQLTYNTSLGQYAVTASGITHPNAIPGQPYTMDSATFTVSNLVTPGNGQGFTIKVSCAQAPIAGTSVSGIGLQIQRAATNSYLRYEDTDAPGFDTLQIGNVPTNRLKLQLFGNPNSLPVDIEADNFAVTGGTVFFDTPVFSVLTLDKDGDIVQVPGISDADGYAIKVFDVIQDPLANYNDFLSPRVMIATNGAADVSGGELYIKINSKIYKYLKSALPITQDNGVLASVTSTGQIPETGITAFAYNGYTQGGLSYIEYIPDLTGVFVKSITTTNLLATDKKIFLDVASINFPFAWNVSDLSTLYFVDVSALKLYDLNETKAAFVNVTSDKQVLAAGTQETATITAQILNVYGEPKSNKSMVFSVSAGDGAISPAVGCSDGNGEDTTTYTVGSAVGTATITVTVSDIVC